MLFRRNSQHDTVQTAVPALTQGSSTFTLKEKHSPRAGLSPRERVIGSGAAPRRTHRCPESGHAAPPAAGRDPGKAEGAASGAGTAASAGTRPGGDGQRGTGSYLLGRARSGGWRGGLRPALGGTRSARAEGSGLPPHRRVVVLPPQYTPGVVVVPPRDMPGVVVLLPRDMLGAVVPCPARLRWGCR